MKFLVLLVAASLAVALSTADAKSWRKPDSFEREALARHNFYRKKHGVAPLSLDPKLTSVAQNWANQMAQTDQFDHNPASQNVYGENIFASSFPKVKGRDAVDAWYKEVQLYNDYNNNHPDYLKIGHFTQVVWKSTTKVGVGKATSRSGKTYVVANYSPPGNTGGMYVANVLPPRA